MGATLILDDLFLETAYRKFLKTYGPLYREELGRRPTLQDLVGAAESYLGEKAAATHVFYLENRPSRFLTGHMVQAAADLLRQKGAEDLLEVLPEDGVIRHALELGGLSAPELLERSSGLTFHPAEFVALEAADFAEGAPDPVLVADDAAYAHARGVEGWVFFRLDGESTWIPPHVRWQDVDYLFAEACGIEP